MRFLDLIGPLLSVLPEVAKPNKVVKPLEKQIWTLIALSVFLLMQNTPLYGIQAHDNADPLFWMHVTMASSRGSLMELGISPLVLSSFGMQILSSWGFLEIDRNSKQDRALYAGAQKLCGLVLTLAQATINLQMGLYGNPTKLGPGLCIIIVAQLMCAALIILLLDDLLQKGYGYGSAISLFIATNVCENVFWRAFSPRTVSSSNGSEFEGSLIALGRALFSGRISNVKRVVYRSGLPNVMELITTSFIFVVVIYLQRLHIDLKLRSPKYPGSKLDPFRINFFYTGQVSLMIQQTIMSQIFETSQNVFRKFPKSVPVQVLGAWTRNKNNGILEPKNGFCYYATAPSSIFTSFTDPIHMILYTLIIVLSSGFISYKWMTLGNSTPKDIMNHFNSQGIKLAEHPQNTFKILESYINTTAILGGMCIGLIKVVSEVLNGPSGTGILLAVSIIYEYYEMIYTA